jgi:hypothetical protein
LRPWASSRNGVAIGESKRVGCANMHHDCVAKRDLSWAWVDAKRLQGNVRCRLVHDPRRSSRGWGLLPGGRRASPLATSVRPPGDSKRVGCANMHLLMRVGTASRSATCRGRGWTRSNNRGWMRVRVAERRRLIHAQALQSQRLSVPPRHAARAHPCTLHAIRLFCHEIHEPREHRVHHLRLLWHAH